MNNNFKFLDITGLTTLVEKIKALVNSAIDSSKVENMTYDSANRKFTIVQQSSNVTSDAIPVASGSAAGLMSSEQLATLNDVNANKVQRICISVDESNVANTLRYDESKANDKLAIIDYTTKLGELTTVTRKQAPTAGAVKDALDAKLDTDSYNTDKETFATKNEVSNQFTTFGESIANTYYNKTEVDAKETALNTAIDKKLDSSVFDSFKTAHDTAHETLNNDITDLSETLTDLTTFTGTINGTTATNVYNKTEVDDAIAGVKSEILGGDITQALKDYDTIKEIAEWITNDESGAAALASKVAANSGAIEDNKNAIDALKGIVGDAGSGLVKDVADLKNKVSEFEGAITDLEEKDSEFEGAITDLENAITGTNGLTARVTKLESDTEDLDTRLNALEDDQDNYATKASAVGSFGPFTRNADGNLELQVKSISGVTLTPITFEVFTEAEIDDLFEPKS